MAQYNTGDKVLFGAYGDFSDSTKVYTICDVTENTYIPGGVMYELKGENGHTFEAYADEIKRP